MDRASAQVCSAQVIHLTRTFYAPTVCSPKLAHTRSVQVLANARYPCMLLGIMHVPTD